MDVHRKENSNLNIAQTGPTISVVITTCNEAEYIRDCLESVAWADEILIVDLESTDGTVSICREYTDKIITHPRVPVVELVRQFGIDQAACEWVLVLDPDERAPARANEIFRSLAADGSADAYALPWDTWMFGCQVKHGPWSAGRHIKFFRRAKVQWPPYVHSRPEVQGVIKTLDSSEFAIKHLNYKSIRHFVEKMNRYTDMEAERLKAAGRPFHWLKLLYQPAKSFFESFVGYRGYRDGVLGLILALLMAFYTQLSYMKLWETCDAAVDSSDSDRSRSNGST